MFKRKIHSFLQYLQKLHFMCSSNMIIIVNCPIIADGVQPDDLHPSGFRYCHYLL